MHDQGCVVMEIPQRRSESNKLCSMVSDERIVYVHVVEYVPCNCTYRVMVRTVWFVRTM